MLGRAGEVGRIDALLHAAANERASGALIVHGDAGVGKTTLLDHAVGSAGEGFTVLRVSPVEAEAELPFTGLFDLVRPVHHLMDRIPDPQRAALSGALAIGPSVPTDRFAVAAATLSLLAAAATDDAPALAVVDDAHWLDKPSREALVFAARRLANDGVVMLFGMRDREWRVGTGIEMLDLSGLAADDAAALVDATGLVVDPGVRRRLVEETGGNPLALLAAIESLSQAQLRGSKPIIGPLASGPALRGAFAKQIDTLPEASRSALLVAAASGTGDMSEIARALAASDLELAALTPAEGAGLITINSRLEFRHPLVRSAAYHRRSTAERRSAHSALAVALGPGVRSAWHLAAASDGPDETLAAELERSGDAAMARSAYAAAASAFEAATELSSDDAGRLRRTLGAARALWVAGELDRAAALVDGVIGLATEPTLRADLQQLRAVALMWRRDVIVSHAELIAEAERVAPADGARAAALFANASLLCCPRGDFAGAEEAALRALAVTDGERSTSALLASILLATVAASRLDVAGARAQLASLAEPISLANPLGELSQILVAAAQTMVWIEEWTQADAIYTRAVAAARAAGAVSLLPFELGMRAEFDLRRGRLAAGYAAATEFVQLADETGQELASSFALATLGRIEAVLGHEQAGRAHLARGLQICRRIGATSVESYSAAALGLLELSHRRPEQAVEHLLTAKRWDRGHGMRLPTAVEWVGDLIEAQLMIGAAEDAAAELADFERDAATSGLRWPQGVAARCRGLLVEDGFEDEFKLALEWFGRDMPFERARTQLCQGMRLRRAQRRADARTPLHEALDYFDAAGAEPWAEQARAELRASGETPALGDVSLRSLTPQELQVALIVAGGVTNREAAASLFLSEKTVEFHLSNTYRKLGLRSRSALTRRVAGLP